MKIPLSAPEITEEDIQAVSAVLRTSRLSLGPKLEEFEQSLAEYTGAAHAVAVNSGTSALHLCVRGFNIGEGGEVIVPSFSFIAVANAVLYERATPVFVDVDPVTLNLDLAKVEAAITHKTRAILLVHTFGCPGDLAEILEIGKRRGVAVMEDACEAIGAEYDGRRVGAFGDAGVFGFYPNKQMTTGEGGALVTNRAELAMLARSLRNQGRGESDDWLQHSEVGFNYRISEMNCALGVEQLRRIESMLETRESIARKYHERLCGSADLILPKMKLPRRKLSWFVYVVRLAERFTREQRDAVVKEMAARGIGCGRYFAPVHQQPAYRNVAYRAENLSVTESVAQRTIALPFFNQITNSQIDEVCERLQQTIRAL